MCIVPRNFSQACCGPVRSARREFRRRSPAAEGCRSTLRISGWTSLVPSRRAASRKSGSFVTRVGGATRVLAIACGYADGNDSARLCEDPIHKLLLDRDPIEGLDLASQPTLSRFENAVGVKELYRVGEFLAESVIERHAKRLRNRTYRVTIDLDPTDDPTHGAQQLSM